MLYGSIWHPCRTGEKEDSITTLHNPEALYKGVVRSTTSVNDVEMMIGSKSATETPSSTITRSDMLSKETPLTSRGRLSKIDGKDDSGFHQMWRRSS